MVPGLVSCPLTSIWTVEGLLKEDVILLVGSFCYRFGTPSIHPFWWSKTKNRYEWFMFPTRFTIESRWQPSWPSRTHQETNMLGRNLTNSSHTMFQIQVPSLLNAAT